MPRADAPSVGVRGGALLRLLRPGPWVAGAALVATLPLGALLAILVWLDLGRPVLFRQQRSGRGGRPFTLLKFRTMRVGTDATGRPLPDEARTTPFGRFLRRSRLDEWPQLLLIARGDLNWIGPRPLLPDTIAAFGTAGEARGRVAPGLTGWAQVNGNTRLGNRSKLALDLWYVEHRTLALDLLILWRTATTLLRGERVDARRVLQAIGGSGTRG